jgi:ankyrin repeat protein
MQYFKKYYKYRLKQFAGSQYQTSHDKLLYVIAMCAQNKFSEVTPFVNLNKSFRKDDQLWSSVCKLPQVHDEPYNEEFLYSIDPDRRDFRKTFLMAAVIGGNLDRINFILPYSNIEAITDFGYSALSLSCDMNRLDIVTFLLDRGAKINTMIMNAVFGKTIQNNNIELFTLLITRGININSYDTPKYGYTFLMYAVSLERLNMVRLLVDHGARLEETYWMVLNTRQSILEYVQSLVERYSDYTVIYDILIRYNASLTDHSDIGYTALMIAIDKNLPEIVEFLCSRGAIVNGEMKIPTD